MSESQAELLISSIRMMAKDLLGARMELDDLDPTEVAESLNHRFDEGDMPLIEAIMEEAGFTGWLTDKIGRRFYFVNGKRQTQAQMKGQGVDKNQMQNLGTAQAPFQDVKSGKAMSSDAKAKVLSPEDQAKWEQWEKANKADWDRVKGSAAEAKAGKTTVDSIDQFTAMMDKAAGELGKAVTVAKLKQFVRELAPQAGEKFGYSGMKKEDLIGRVKDLVEKLGQANTNGELDKYAEDDAAAKWMAGEVGDTQPEEQAHQEPIETKSQQDVGKDIFDAVDQHIRKLGIKAKGGPIRIPDVLDEMEKLGLSRDQAKDQLWEWKREGKFRLTKAVNDHLEPRREDGIQTNRGNLFYISPTEKSEWREPIDGLDKRVSKDDLRKQEADYLKELKGEKPDVEVGDQEVQPEEQSGESYKYSGSAVDAESALSELKNVYGMLDERRDNLDLISYEEVDKLISDVGKLDTKSLKAVAKQFNVHDMSGGKNSVLERISHRIKERMARQDRGKVIQDAAEKERTPAEDDGYGVEEVQPDNEQYDVEEVGPDTEQADVEEVKPDEEVSGGSEQIESEPKESADRYKYNTGSVIDAESAISELNNAYSRVDRRVNDLGSVTYEEIDKLLTDVGKLNAATLKDVAKKFSVHDMSGGKSGVLERIGRRLKERMARQDRGKIIKDAADKEMERGSSPQDSSKPQSESPVDDLVQDEAQGEAQDTQVEEQPPEDVQPEQDQMQSFSSDNMDFDEKVTADQVLGMRDKEFGSVLGTMSHEEKLELADELSSKGDELSKQLEKEGKELRDSEELKKINALYDQVVNASIKDAPEDFNDLEDEEDAQPEEGQGQEQAEEEPEFDKGEAEPLQGQDAAEDDATNFKYMTDEEFAQEDPSSKGFELKDGNWVHKDYPDVSFKDRGAIKKKTKKSSSKKK